MRGCTSGCTSRSWTSTAGASSRDRLAAAARAARDAGFGSLCANDHVLFSRPWLDGLVALAAVVPDSGDLELVTTAAVPALRHPLVLAKSLVALDLLSGGRVVAGLGAGSSAADYEAVGVPFEERWQRLGEAARLLRHVLRGEPAPAGAVFYPPTVPPRSAPLAGQADPGLAGELGVSPPGCGGWRATATAGWRRRTTRTRTGSRRPGPSSRPTCRPHW